MIKLGKTLIYPIFDVESIGEVSRGPRAHLEAVLKKRYIVRRFFPLSLAPPQVCGPCCGVAVD